MDFQPTEQQRMIVETARKVGETFGLDYWRDLDAKKEFPHEAWRAICEAGLSSRAPRRLRRRGGPRTA
jgi:acyl-CoA dehydrogenase